MQQYNVSQIVDGKPQPQVTVVATSMKDFLSKLSERLSITPALQRLEYLNPLQAWTTLPELVPDFPTTIDGFVDGSTFRLANVASVEIDSKFINQVRPTPPTQLTPPPRARRRASPS
jgi:hypothetical protein